MRRKKTPEEKKEYDRAHNKALYTQFQEQRVKVFALLGDECYLCRIPAVKGFHLHHISYHKTESAYARHSNSMNTRLKRSQEAFDHPERFKLLCPQCHRKVEFLRTGKVKLDRVRLDELLAY